MGFPIVQSDMSLVVAADINIGKIVEFSSEKSMQMYCESVTFDDFLSAW